MIFIGEISAIAAALIWAIASVIYARLGQTADPMGLNFAKGVVALALLLLTPTLWLQNLDAIPPLSGSLLFLSGVFGIGLGDTFYFEMLKALGPRKSLLLDALAPIFTASVAWIVLKEVLSIASCGGIVMTLSGIVWVVRERTPEDKSSAQLRRGITLAIAAGVSNSLGALMARAALMDSQIKPEFAAMIRIAAGVIFLSLWGLSRNILQQWWQTIFRDRRFKTLAIAAFGSTYLGIWLQQIGFKHAPAGITQTLLATSPLFILPIATIQGQRISARAWCGAIIAVLGIGILFWFR
ncbi:MAG: DMT family transporter [Cyanobacteria bacterium P01_F01_bin.42]